MERICSFGSCEPVFAAIIILFFWVGGNEKHCFLVMPQEFFCVFFDSLRYYTANFTTGNSGVSAVLNGI